MDLSKLQFEKAFHFVAGMIPGFIALIIYELAHPGVFEPFFSNAFLGYRSKLALVAIIAFVVGNSMTAILSGIIGAIGGSLGDWHDRTRPYVPAYQHKIAPWRDQRWRIALTNRLGAKAPNNSCLLPDSIWDQRRKLVEHLPEQERPAALFKINSEKLNTEQDDFYWEQWYDHYHRIIALEQHRKWDLADYFRRGLYFNLETSSIYVLISALVVPGLRHWWVIVPSSLWVLTLFAEVFTSMSNWWNKWSSLSAQITYLSESHDPSHL